MNFDATTLAFLIHNTDDPGLCARAIDAMSAGEDLPEPKVSLPPEWVLAQQLRNDERSEYAVRNCADPDTLHEIARLGWSTAVLWELLRNPYTTPATLDLLESRSQHVEKIRQHLAVRRADRRPALERFEEMLVAANREWLLVGNVMDMLEELVDEGHPECVDRFFDFAAVTGFDWPLKILLERTYGWPRSIMSDPRARSDSRIFEVLSKSVFTLIDELYEAGAHQISAIQDQLLIWLLSLCQPSKNRINPSIEEEAPIPDVTIGAELATLIVKWVPKPPWLRMTLPTAWVTSEAADVFLASDYWWGTLNPACLDDEQFKKVVTRHPHPEWIIRELRANKRESAPRDRLEVIFAALQEGQLDKEGASEVVLDSCYSQDDELFVKLVRYASPAILMRYLAGKWMVMGHTVFPKIQDVARLVELVVASDALTRDNESRKTLLCASANFHGASFEYCLELMDLVPGTASKLVANIYGENAPFKPYLYQRLEDTGIGVEYALEQVLAHPEVSLRAMCKSLTLQASLVARGI